MPDAPPAPSAPAVAAPAAAPESTVFDLAGSEAFGAIDALSTERSDVDHTPEPAAPKKPVPPKGEDGKFIKPDKAKVPTKPEVKPEPKKGEVKPPAELDFDNPPEKAADLRKHYDALKVRLKESEAKRDELAKAPKPPTEWPEKKTYEERLAEREKKLATYEEEMRYLNYSKSEEYKEKFEKPYVNAYTSGRKAAAALRVIERKDAETGAVTQEARKGTADDFDAIMKARDPEAAADLAVQLFGETRAAMVLHHVEISKTRAEEAETAIAEYREKGKQWETERQAKQSDYMKRGEEVVSGYMNAAREKFPQFFKPDENDPKGNELLEQGQHLVARLVANGAPLADGETQWNGEDMAKAVASLRTKAGGFDRLFYKFREQSKELAELKTKLEAYETSTPGDGDGHRGPAGGRGGDDEDEDAFKKLDAMAREVPTGA